MTIGANLAQEFYTPPPGVPPTCPSRFHLWILHIILDEWLDNSMNDEAGETMSDQYL